MTLRIADIRVEWENIKDAVAKALNGERAEDVYAACKFGRASLVMAENGAFCVCRTEVDGFTGETVCWLWVICGPSGTTTDYVAEFDELAKKNGATLLRYAAYSGWDRLGWTKTTTLYERRLS